MADAERSVSLEIIQRFLAPAGSKSPLVELPNENLSHIKKHRQAFLDKVYQHIKGSSQKKESSLSGCSRKRGSKKIEKQARSDRIHISGYADITLYHDPNYYPQIMVRKKLNDRRRFHGVIGDIVINSYLL